MKAMLLAAGRGERMRELTHERPKPLLEVGAESLIERHLRALSAAGIGEVVINVSYRAAQIEHAVGNGARFGLDVRFSREGEPPLETAGGIVQALPLLGDEPFLVVNCDVFTDFDFARLAGEPTARAPSARPGSGTLVLVPNPPHHPRGDFGVDAYDRVTPGPTDYTFAGISVLDPALFAGLAPGRRPLKPVLDAAIAERALTALCFDGLWIDVGTPERLAAARAVSPTP